MLGKFLEQIQFNLSRVGKRAEKLWNDAPNPTLICALEIRHSIICEREEVDLTISKEEARIQYRRYERSRALVETHDACLPAPNDLEATLRSMGIFELRSVSEPLFDGSWASIATKDPTHRNLFKEHSIETPQARLCDFLLKLARPAADNEATNAHIAAES